jgi:hypothetical protein
MQTAKASISRILKSPFSTWFWLSITFIAIVLVTSLGPAEHNLGTHIRIVYLHGAWVWASIIIFFLSAVCGGIGLLSRRNAYHCWSSAFGRTGLLLWITYLPLSLWVMQSNWNGLFLAEPRWRLALMFAISGVLLQVGLSLANKPGLTSALNIVYFISLVTAIQNTSNVMHPASPILNSDAWKIQVFFGCLVLLSLVAAFQIARWWYKREPDCTTR